MGNFNEAQQMEAFETKVEKYDQKYENIFSETAGSAMFTKNTLKGEASREWSAMDSYVLGEQFETYNAYEKFVKESSSAADLGALPQIAHDLIAVTYAVSVAPLLAIIQSIEEEEGIIYFKHIRALDTRKDITAGQEFANAKEGIVNSLSNYVGEFCENVTEETTVSATLTYDFTVTNFPIRANKEVKVTIAAPVNLDGVFFRDAGTVNTGTLFSSKGHQGTINYDTGAVHLVLAVDPAGALPIVMSYSQDFEKSDDIPEVEWVHTTTNVKAEILAVKEGISTFKAFQFNKRWGRLAEDEALMDLVGIIADAESRKVILKLDELADISQTVYFGGNAIVFDATLPGGVSEWEHRNAFKFRITTVDSDINSMAGRGRANRYVAGHKACEYLSSTPGFVRAPENIAVGPHVYGYLDGAPVIRTKYIPTNEVIGVYKNPTSPFEGAVVCATYMPVFVTNTMQVSNNPFTHQRATATWKAFKGVVEQFVRRIQIDNIP